MFFRDSNGVVQYWDERYGDPPSALSLGDVSNSAAPLEAEPPPVPDMPAQEDPLSNVSQWKGPPKSLANGLNPPNLIDEMSPSFLGMSMFPTTEMAFRYQDALRAGNQTEARAVINEADAFRKEQERRAEKDKWLNRLIMMGLGVASGPPGTYGNVGAQLSRGILTGLNYSQGMEQQDDLSEYRQQQVQNQRARAMAYADQVAQSRRNANAPDWKLKKVVDQNGNQRWVYFNQNNPAETRELPQEVAGAQTSPYPTYTDETGNLKYRTPGGGSAPVRNADGTTARPKPDNYYQIANGWVYENGVPVRPAPRQKEIVDTQYADDRLKAAEIAANGDKQKLAYLNGLRELMASPSASQLERKQFDKLVDRSFSNKAPTNNPLDSAMLSGLGISPSPALGPAPTPAPSPTPSPPQPSPVLPRQDVGIAGKKVISSVAERLGNNENVSMKQVLEELMQAEPTLSREQAVEIVRSLKAK